MTAKPLDHWQIASLNVDGISHLAAPAPAQNLSESGAWYGNTYVGPVMSGTLLELELRTPVENPHTIVALVLHRSASGKSCQGLIFRESATLSCSFSEGGRIAVTLIPAQE